MKIAFFILIVLHGAIHLLGFVKGLGIKEVKELTLPISKSMGITWLLAATLLIVYGILYLIHSKYAWLVGIIAVLISQALVFIFWKDAKFGTFPNLLILLISLIAWGQFQFQNKVHQETRHLLQDINDQEHKILQEHDFSELPPPVKKWIRNSGSVGKPLVQVGEVFQKAEMRMKPDQKNWMQANAKQYTRIDQPSFIWTVDVKMNLFLNFQGRDKFENGKGSMLIKLNSLVNIVNEEGEKLDEGSLQRYLGEMVWFPSLALSPFISWEMIDETTAKASMEFQGTSGSGTFYFNDQGDVVRFSAMRYMDNNDGAERKEWIMDISDYQVFEGIKVPSKMTATWRLDEGDWTWLKLEVTDLKFNRWN
ncbi:hypothetical protein JYB62_09570 [Algoriphagus lutimaris]|uniref:DUF6544 family protein n=1 Tax=Algoriphagus lutimaris TaxID=613197 RepID=UPI00196B7AA2|nr:DUF6544 family protein [Algoriphagus lutimaris]MBN3520251.1 hypothetical protein [Algoriphagus lutimaris]